ncbi:Hypothetical protein CINCED_3A001182 [Cinara cedri]|uniref:Uncharacterized protein n=2 Tax=Cinara cedri TaxID=506608 RepID=A0A5E4MU43_9HEMI|nr:Hypothetical protein CINCED_3A001182 [Cinara cedri]
MHRANKVSSQMTVHSLSQSQTIIHESNNIHRLLPSNPIIHQDQFSTLSVPRPVSNENMQYGDSSRNHVQNIQLSYQQTIRIKQEPESDNESDINTDVSVQYEQYNEQVVQNYSEKIEENVQYGDSSRNHGLNTQSTSQQTIKIKQEPESDNEPDINTRRTRESYNYGRFIEDQLNGFSDNTKEAVQFEFFKILSKAEKGYYE